MKIQQHGWGEALRDAELLKISQGEIGLAAKD